MSTTTLEAAPASLSLRNVGKTYSIDGQNLPVLQRIGLEIPRGEFLSIVGASGCGKSTLLRLIAGLDDRFDGDILIEGRPVAGPGVERSLVFQDHRLFPWLSVTDNIALGLDSLDLSRREREARIQEQLELVGLTGFAQAWPHQLSGGMAQRAAIARALVSRPDILLMDEPFGALDSITRAHMQEELLRIWRERRVTVVIVTHDVDEAVFLGDRVAVMEPRPGRVQNVIEVGLPRPRERTGAAFNHIKQRVLAQLKR
ncbi:ABC transporter ATP-binding protein [Hydrogenophaga palleronii]|uniref:ABC transporter ATP-binding protein n=1 Tax=Hydrogenophaga palleronii TaxID=65655 RepID=UPI000824D9E1|nr:ABC transporter ATP-binding protein [Hydrogenophaga palleronii]